MASLEVDLRDMGGNPMAFRRIAGSHGLAGVDPWRRTGLGELSVAIATPAGPRRLRFSCSEPEQAGSTVSVSWSGRIQDLGGHDKAVALVRRMLGLQRDLTEFLAIADSDADLDWVRSAGAGAMARGATVFEDVVRTILTTNCSWALTVKMCELLVSAVGEPIANGEDGSTFPTATAIADMTESDLREQVRVGYRAGRLLELARAVASGRLNLEALGDPSQIGANDAQLRDELLALPGVGPYAAAHIMLLIGRPAGVILDSWTRPKYARLTGRKKVTDSQMMKRVSRYGPDAGLALWLILSSDWFEPVVAGTNQP